MTMDPVKQKLMDELLAAVLDIQQAEGAALTAAAEYDTQEARLLLSGEITGKNAEERKAQLHLRLAVQARKVAETKLELHTHQNSFAALRSVARLLGAGE